MAIAKTDPKRVARRERETLELTQMAPLLTAQEMEMIKLRAFEFSGQLPEFESAVGALIMGKLYGSRVLRIIHEPKTYAKYQRLLGVKFADVCDPEGPLYERSVGYEVARKLGDFWKVVRGEVPGRSHKVVGVDLPEGEPVG